MPKRMANGKGAMAGRKQAPKQRSKKAAPKERRWRWRTLALGAFLTGAFALGFYLAGLYTEISALIEQRRAALASTIYAAPTTIAVATDIGQLGLLDRLRRLSYSPVTAATRPGEYGQSPGSLTLFLRGFRWGVREIPAQIVQLRLDGATVAEIHGRAGQSLASVMLEPEVIGRLMPDAPAQRVEVPLNELPPYLVGGLLATEDRFFYYHPGFDPIRIIEAAISDLRAHRLVQGASTITQQLARTFLSRRRTFDRKFRELAIALVLEIRLSKHEILERYINDVAMGDYHGAPIYGLPLAARYLFNKDLREVSPAESAVLIGMIQAPSLYDPRRHPDLSRARRDTVLALMRRAGLLDDHQMQAARAEPIGLSQMVIARPAPYFADYVAELVAQIPGFDGHLEGLKVYTTLDPQAQETAVNALADNLQRLEQAHRRLRSAEQPLESSMVVLDARGGGILAMVGGRDYGHTQFNRAVLARRQAGSAFKPIVYLSALDPSRCPLGHPLTLASMLPDRPMSFGGWTPANYERTYKGQVSVAEALVESLNVPTAYVASLIGTGAILKTARDLGIETPLPRGLSMSIGTGEITLLELTGAYQVFANAGTACRPYAIDYAVDRFGHLIFRHDAAPHRVIDPAVAYLMTGVLQGVLAQGTAASSRALGVDFPAAGKTGTTDDYHDAYFIGYTPRLVCGVWVGFDEPRSLGLTGAQAALPAWADFMMAATGEQEVQFPQPAGTTIAVIDPDTGGLATAGCPHRISVPFLAGTAPTLYCPLHGGAPLVASAPGALPQPVQPVSASGTTSPSAMPVNTEGVFGAITGFIGSIFGH